MCTTTHRHILHFLNFNLLDAEHKWILLKCRIPRRNKLDLSVLCNACLHTCILMSGNCRRQLLALTLQSEKPELEERKSKLLQAEEEKKVQLAELEDSLLQVRNKE